MSEICGYKYNKFPEGLTNARRESNVCGRPADPNCGGGCRPENPGLPGGRKACFWHCACQKSYLSPGRVKRGRPDLGTALGEALPEDPSRYLEGAFLCDADLKGAKLNGASLPLADLRNATLDNANLADACLWHADLENAHLWNVVLDGCELREANLRNADFYHAEPANVVDVRLHRAHVDRRTDLGNITWGRLGEEKKAEDAKAKNNPEEAAKQWGDAAGVLGVLEEYYRERSDYQRSDEFYVRKMKCRHRALRMGRRGPRVARTPWWDCLVWWLHGWVWGYGVRPWWVARLMAGIIFIWAAFFVGTGVEKPRVPEFPAHASISRGAVAPHRLRAPAAAPRQSGGGAARPWERNRPGWTHPGPGMAPDKASRSLGDAFGLSLITFSTLGYGNWHPGGLWWCATFGHVLGGAEALLGVLLCAAFLVSLATKYVHRA